MSTATGVVTVGTAVFLGVFGVLVRVYEMNELLAGYDPEAVTDDGGLARFTGRNILYIAVFTAATGVVVVAELFQNQTVLWTVYTAGVLLLTAWTVYGTQQYAG